MIKLCFEYVRTIKPQLFLGFFLGLAAGASAPIQAAAPPPAPALTTNNAAIPLDQLKWLLKPLTTDALIIEANAWRDLLSSKVTQIGHAEIANKRKNEQIEKAEDAAEAVAEAKDAAEKANQLAQTATDDSAADAAEKAKQKAAEAAKAISEANQTKQQVEQDASAQAAKEIVQEVQKKQAEEGDGTTASPASNTNEAPETIQEVGDTNRVAEAGELKAVAEQAQKVAKQEAAEKSQILKTLATLREERADLVSRLNVVLVELKAKGGDVESYEKYRDAVSEIMVDVSDTSAVWTFVSSWITSEQGGIKWAINAGKFLVTMLVFILLSIVIGKGVEKATGASKGMSTLIRQFTLFAVRRGIILIGLLVAVSALGIPVGPLLAVITAVGFVIGLALQGTLSNFASGLLLLFYRPFDIGDAVEAGGVAGSVKAMNLMSTVIMTWDHKVMIVPNNSIWGNVITNISRTQRRRVDLMFGIGYGDSIDKAQAVLEKIVNEHPKVLKDPEPVVKVHELGDSSVNFVVRPWVIPSDYWAVYWDVTRKVKEEFDKAGVSIPFPQRDVHLYQADK